MIYSIDALIKEYKKENRHKFVFFYGHTQKGKEIDKSCFSQWFITDFIINNIKYNCTEQYMMAEKARLFKDEKMLEKIMKTCHPKEMKAYGRAVENFNKTIWEENCYRIVKTGNMAKFSQNIELLNFIKLTNKRILVEASPRDRIWGIGMGINNPNVENPLAWRGKNLLGFALTEVRDELLKEKNYDR